MAGGQGLTPFGVATGQVRFLVNKTPIMYPPRINSHVYMSVE